MAQVLSPLIQTHPNLHSSPVWVGQRAFHPQREGTNLGVFVPKWLVLPQCGATNLGAFDLRHFDLLKRGCANSGGLELVDTLEVYVMQLGLPCLRMCVLKSSSCKNTQKKKYIYIYVTLEEFSDTTEYQPKGRFSRVAVQEKTWREGGVVGGCFVALPQVSCTFLVWSQFCHRATTRSLQN